MADRSDDSQKFYSSHSTASSESDSEASRSSSRSRSASPAPVGKKDPKPATDARGKPSVRGATATGGKQAVDPRVKAPSKARSKSARPTLAGARVKEASPSKERTPSVAVKPPKTVVERPPAPKPVRGKDKLGVFYRSGRTGRKCYYTPKDYSARMAAQDKALRHSGYD